MRWFPVSKISTYVWQLDGTCQDIFDLLDVSDVMVNNKTEGIPKLQFYQLTDGNRYPDPVKILVFGYFEKLDH